MLQLLKLDSAFEPPEECQPNIALLDRPPLEWSVDLPQYHIELRKADESQVKYVLIKTILEIEKCLKITSPLQKVKVNMLAKLFAEVSISVKFQFELGSHYCTMQFSITSGPFNLVRSSPAADLSD